MPVSDILPPVHNLNCHSSKHSVCAFTQPAPDHLLNVNHYFVQELEALEATNSSVALVHLTIRPPNHSRRLTVMQSFDLLDISIVLLPRQ